MAHPSRMRRLALWFRAFGRSLASLFYLPNLKNACRSVIKNRKEYASFYLAALLMVTGFAVIALTADANTHEARERVETAYDYHVEVAVLNNEQFANLDAILIYETARDNEYISSFYWANDKQPLADKTYTAYVRFSDSEALSDSLAVFENDILGRISTGRREVRLSPLYTFDEDFGTPYATQFWAVSLLWLALSVVMLTVLFLVRLDHFRFVYGVYMACGADLPALVGMAGGELLAVIGLTLVPSLLIGFGLTAAMTLPMGVGLWVSIRSVIMVLLGSLAAVLLSVWFPMRRLSRRAPVEHLTAIDHTGSVSSPRRSFAFAGRAFPVKYELYGFFRMRKYYLRLVLSAVLFAACFVSGLYIAEMDAHHESLDPAEYMIAYRSDAYYDYMDALQSEETKAPDGEETEDETDTPAQWLVDADEAEMVWSDADLFLSDIESIPGVSHATWDVSYPGGRTLSHLLLTTDQLYRGSDNSVASDERSAGGHRWAVNNYAYTAVDKTWIDNAIRHDLCTFEGNPYDVLYDGRRVIISEDIFNEQTFSFKPGDTVIVAVCDEAGPTPLVLDPRQNLRNQIDTYTFHYETFTVAAVMRGMSSTSNITFGVTYDRYASLANVLPARTDLTVYMEPGTDLSVVRDADGELRGLLASFLDWTVTPTGNYFDAGVRSLKNDGGLILTLTVCLLLISPVIWCVSQLLFYRRRRQEFKLLAALGAPRKAFATLHRHAGGLLAGVAFLVTVLLSLLCNTAVYGVVNTFLPKLGLIESVHYDLTFSLPALIACVIISAVCGFLSCEIPYRIHTKEGRQDHLGSPDQ